MASDVLSVVLEGRPIGELERLAGGTLRLRFDDAYRSDPEATLLSVSMPPSTESHFDAVVRPWLWGLLPDNEDVLRRWGRDFGVSVASPYPLLSTQVGHDCAGAVQFCRPDDLDGLLSRPGSVSWLDEAQIATRLRMLRADSTNWLGPGITGQFSLAGSQAKTALHHVDGRWGVPSGALPTTHILKPAVRGFADQHVNEHICMAAAKALGLEAGVTRIEAFEDETAIVVERFDRLTRDGALVRVHQEDVCQAMAVSPERKYQSDGGPTPAAIAELLRTAIPSPDAETDVRRFADALAFNWLIAGTDAHAKNYSLLLSGTQVRLAPLYDIASYLPYDDSYGRKVKLAMKIGADYRLLRTDRRSAWERTAGQLGLDASRLIERASSLAERAPGTFATAAEEAVEAGIDAGFSERLTELVAERCRRCVRVLS